MTPSTACTPPHVWEAAIHAQALPPFDPQRYRQVLVVAAHPDDETLAASGTLQALHDAGAALRLVVATDGEAAFPALERGQRAELAATRRRELYESLVAQGLDDTPVCWAHLPDSALGEHIPALTELLRGQLTTVDACLVPWTEDPHPDHRAAAVAARAAVAPCTPVWGYPVWTRPWTRPDDGDVPWAQARTHRLTGRQLSRKQAGIAAFGSQLRAGPGGAEPILPPEVLAHFTRGDELLLRTSPNGGASTPVERFTQLYAADPDPWQTAESRYERRKRDVTLTCLPRPRYGEALDLACGTGMLTAQLARCCDRVLGVDAVPAAVATARSATADHPNVEIRALRLPDQFPLGRFDLIVCSEILYYLGDHDLAATLDAVRGALRPGGDLLAVSWLPPADDAPQTADEAHHRLLRHPGLDCLTCHRDDRFLVHVARRR